MLESLRNYGELILQSTEDENEDDSEEEEDEEEGEVEVVDESLYLRFLVGPMMLSSRLK